MTYPRSTSNAARIYTAVRMLVLLSSGCACEPRREDTVVASSQAIYGGNAEPRFIGMPAEQRLAIGLVKPTATSVSAFCTGVMIADDVMLTARYCRFGGELGVELSAGRPDGSASVLIQSEVMALVYAGTSTTKRRSIPDEQCSVTVTIVRSIPDLSWAGSWQ